MKYIFKKELTREVLIGKLISLCKKNEKVLFDKIIGFLSRSYDKVEVYKDSKNFNKSFIHCSYNDAKDKSLKLLNVTLCAHLDVTASTGGKKRSRIEDVFIDKDGILSSPQGICGDDRCGVFAILYLLDEGFRPSIIFSCGEECGGVGASSFVRKHKQYDTNFFVQIDRRGVDDVVCYSDCNPDLTKAFEKYGFKKAYGSFTDISTYMPAYGISGVNVSCGYNYEHTTSEIIDYDALIKTIKRLTSILKDDDIVCSKFNYKEQTYDYHSYLSGFWGGVSKYAPKKPSVNKFSSLYSPTVTKSYECNCCDNCGRFVLSDLYPIEDEFLNVCSECLDNMINTGEVVQCKSCETFFTVDSACSYGYFSDPYDISYDLPQLDCCPYCGASILLKKEEN